MGGAIAICWLPLVLLAAFVGNGGSGGITFFADVEVHSRFLVAVPVLIIGEMVANRRLGSTVKRFVESGIVGPSHISRFSAALAWAMRWRDAAVIELSLLVVIFMAGRYLRLSQFVPTAGWYGTQSDGALKPSPAGIWLTFVSIPIWQFLLIRWYLRLVLWFALLGRIARLPLALSALHPDRAGGLGFVGTSAYAFAPILFAQGTVISGMIANQVFHQGQELASFKMDVAGLVLLQILVVLGPFAMFMPHLARAKRAGRGKYGSLATHLTRGFEDRWLRADVPSGETAAIGIDIQSLSALGSSYALAAAMRLLPFSTRVIVDLSFVAIAPLLPVMVICLPLEPVVDRLIKVIL